MSFEQGNSIVGAYLRGCAVDNVTPSDPGDKMIKDYTDKNTGLLKGGVKKYDMFKRCRDYSEDVVKGEVPVPFTNVHLTPSDTKEASDILYLYKKSKQDAQAALLESVKNLYKEKRVALMDSLSYDKLKNGIDNKIVQNRTYNKGDSKLTLLTAVGEEKDLTIEDLVVALRTLDEIAKTKNVFPAFQQNYANKILT